MNWKIGLIGMVGALLVGAAVAVLITGGSGETTVVERTVPAEEPAAETDTTEEPDPTEVAESEPPESEGVPLPDEVGRSVEGENVEFSGADDSNREIDGEPLENGGVFTLDYSSINNPLPWRIELPVPGYSTLSMSRLGWVDGTSTLVGHTFEVYADDSDEPLYSETFEGPGDVKDMNIDIEGVNTLIFEWDLATPRSDYNNTPDFEVFFGVDEAVLEE
jgi:hypothetical protein